MFTCVRDCLFLTLLCCVTVFVDLLLVIICCLVCCFVRCSCVDFVLFDFALVGFGTLVGWFVWWLFCFMICFALWFLFGLVVVDLWVRLFSLCFS